MNPPENTDSVLLVKWHDTANWLLDRVDSFPKNQRFIFGTRVADRTIGILELLVEATYAPKAQKKILLEQVNRDLAVLRWLVRMAKERKLLSVWQYGYACRAGKGTHAGMRRAAQFARKYPYALKCDIRKYFANIDHEILSNQLARVIGDARVLSRVIRGGAFNNNENNNIGFRVAASPRTLNVQKGNRNRAVSAVPALDYPFVRRFCFAERRIRMHRLRRVVQAKGAGGAVFEY